MDYEKLHKDTINKLQQMVNSGKITVETARGICADFVPESEDEKVRKEIIYHIQYCDDTIDEVAEKRMIAWLEKQGEQNLIMAKSPQLGEQKPADKVEPKFRIGDLITNGILVGKIDEIHELGYHAYFGDHYADVPDAENWHKWTIEDAKDGDVLYECNEKKPFIFKELETKHIGDIASYCDIFNGIFNPNEDNWTTLDIVPATKEQRELLFQKMKEAGYEWNSEHKQLEKIEQKIAWSKVDERMITRIVESLSAYADKLQYEGFCHNSEVLYEQIDWLKSLRPQSTWKPSDEQLKSLQEVIYQGHFTSYPNSLETLYEQLKKLRVE